MPGRARALLVGVSLCVVLAGCRRAEPEPHDRVLLIGIDAATWDVMRPLIAAGKLPTFARLVGTGWSATLLSVEPTVSPMIWTTIATGKSPEAHGIRGFLSTDGTDRPESEGVPVTSNLRRTEALWTIAGREGRRVNVVGWYVTWPAEPVNGVMVSDRFVPDEGAQPKSGTPAILSAAEHAVSPESLAPELERLFVRSDRFLDPYEREFHRLFKIYPVDATRTAITEHLMRTAPADLTMVYLWGIDPMQHHFWRFYRPGSVPGAPVEANDAINTSKIPDYYASVDGFVARLVAPLRPNDTVMIVSDHGAGPMPQYDAATGLSGNHRLEGIVILSGNHVRPAAGSAPPSVRDVTPTVLYLLGLPIAADMDGALIRDAIDPAFLAAHPPQTIATYERGTATTPAVPVPSPMDDQIKERLRSLGYIR